MLITMRILWIACALCFINYFTIPSEYIQRSPILHGLTLLLFLLTIGFIYIYYIYKACTAQFPRPAVKWCWIALVVFVAPISSLIFHMMVLEKGKITDPSPATTAPPAKKP
ncbi:hypothetical protein KDK77_06915 [bacterium]|nr:hypothetical protein [bacterium]MCP5461648.1 hypothetical protein [bacterium]